jgi:hypothetical protein
LFSFTLQEFDLPAVKGIPPENPLNLSLEFSGGRHILEKMPRKRHRKGTGESEKQDYEGELRFFMSFKSCRGHQVKNANCGGGLSARLPLPRPPEAGESEVEQSRFVDYHQLNKGIQYE